MGDPMGDREGARVGTKLGSVDIQGAVDSDAGAGVGTAIGQSA